MGGAGGTSARGVSATGGVIRGAIRFGGAVGATDGGAMASTGGVVTGATRGSGVGRRTGGASVGTVFAAGSVALKGVAAGAGLSIGGGGTLRWGGTAGVCSPVERGAIEAGGEDCLGSGRGFRGSSVLCGITAGLSPAEGSATGVIDGKGRVCTGGGIVAVGGAGTTGRIAGEAVGAAVETGDEAGGRVALGVITGDGRIRGVGVADEAAVTLGRGLGATVAAGAAVALGRGVGAIVAIGRAVGATVAIDPGVAVAAIAGGAAGATVAAAVAPTAGALGASAGFTNLFGGAFGGGVASALILVRARSAAERSVMAVQPLSTATSETRSLTLRGRWNPLTLRKRGMVISISSPRTIAARGSAFISE